MYKPTFLERLKHDHPDWDDDELQKHVLQDCPYKYGYSRDPKCHLCGEVEVACTVCWNQQMPCPSQPGGNTRCIYNSVGNRDCMACHDKYDSKTELINNENKNEREDVKMSVDPTRKAEATEVYAIMEAYMSAGFTREEAFALTLKWFDTAAAVAKMAIR